MESLKNKIILITGASSGIGEACAKVFAQQGARLLICARRLERLEKLREQLKQQYSSDIHIFKLDVSDSNAVTAAFSQLANNWQNIDILVNNAGLALNMDKLPIGNIDDWDQMINTNIKGLLYVTRAVLPRMMQNNHGHIINIGSIAGHEVYTGGAVYCATKFAVNALTKSLRKDLIGTKIRVSSVDPGAVETEFSNIRFKGDLERAKKLYEGFEPLTADDIADAVFYCASRRSNVNIQDLVIMPVAQAAIDVIHREPIAD
jgi:NADP-dependent 3-hydroxy acid dehydrogenase YdfG